MNRSARRLAAYNARKAAEAAELIGNEGSTAVRAAHYGYTGFRGSTAEERRRYLRSIGC